MGTSSVSVSPAPDVYLLSPVLQLEAHTSGPVPVDRPTLRRHRLFAISLLLTPGTDPRALSPVRRQLQNYNFMLGQAQVAESVGQRDQLLGCRKTNHVLWKQVVHVQTWRLSLGPVAARPRESEVISRCDHHSFLLASSFPLLDVFQPTFWP